METSMTVLDAYLSRPGVLAGKSTDLLGGTWTFEFKFDGYYSNEMADGIFADVLKGRQPFLYLTYNRDRDKYMVMDDHDNSVALSRFSNWQAVD